MISEGGRKYRTAVAEQVATQQAAHGIKQRVTVEIEVIEPDRRKRDIDNLLKATLDSLTHAGVWEDDGQIDDLRIWRTPGRLGGMLKVKIRPTEEPCSES